MKVKSIMTSDPATCARDDSLATAASIMWNQDCGVVPVVERAGGKLEGVVTDRDICMSAMMANQPMTTLLVESAMSKRGYTCTPNDTVRSVHALMRDHEVRRVPVVDDEGVLVGIVTLADLATEAYAGRSAAAKKRQADVGKTLAAIAFPRELLEAELEEIEELEA